MSASRPGPLAHLVVRKGAAAPEPDAAPLHLVERGTAPAAPPAAAPAPPEAGARPAARGGSLPGGRVQLGLRLDAQTTEALRVAAFTERTTVQAILEQLVDDYLERRSGPG